MYIYSPGKVGKLIIFVKHESISHTAIASFVVMPSKKSKPAVEG